MSGEVADAGVGDEAALGEGEVAQGRAQPAQLHQASVRQLEHDQSECFKTYMMRYQFIDNETCMNLCIAVFFLCYNVPQGIIYLVRLSIHLLYLIALRSTCYILNIISE